MKFVLALLAFLAAAALGFAQEQEVRGVEDGSTWKNNSGKQVVVDVTPTPPGNGADIKITDQSGGSATTTGTLGSNGNAQSSGEVTINDDRYRIYNGKVQWYGTNGWVDMYQVTNP